MSPRTMGEAADIYAVTSTAVIAWDIVEHPLFEEFSVGLNGLERVLGDDGEDDLWLEIRRILRRARSAVSATPLPFRHTGLGVAMACHDLRPRLARARA